MTSENKKEDKISFPYTTSFSIKGVIDDGFTEYYKNIPITALGIRKELKNFETSYSLIERNVLRSNKFKNDVKLKV